MLLNPVEKMYLEGKSIRTCIITGIYLGKLKTSEMKVKYIRDILKYYRVGLKKVYGIYQKVELDYFQIETLSHIDYVNRVISDLNLRIRKLENENKQLHIRLRKRGIR